MKGKVSVCMATYNGASYIREQLDSILCQLGPEDEVIISDDGSLDGTLDVIASIHDSRIRVVHHVKDPKISRTPEIVGANFENALSHCSGEYIFISDQDDIWLPDKVGTMTSYLSKYALVACNARILMDGKETDRMIYRDRQPVRNYTLRRGKYYGCCMAFTRDMLRYVLPFPSKLPLYDYWIGLISEIVGGAYYISEPLVLHRVHASNTSRTLKLSSGYKIFYRFRLLAQLYFRLLFILLKIE